MCTVQTLMSLWPFLICGRLAEHICSQSCSQQCPDHGGLNQTSPPSACNQPSFPRCGTHTLSLTWLAHGQRHRMAEVGQDLWKRSSLLKAGLTRWGCSRLRPKSAWAPPVVEIPQLLWAAPAKGAWFNPWTWTKPMFPSLVPLSKAPDGGAFSERAFV